MINTVALVLRIISVPSGHITVKPRVIIVKQSDDSSKGEFDERNKAAPDEKTK